MIATFDYKAQQDDELNLTKGDKLIVTAKDEEGWWTGKKENGNMVEIIIRGSRCFSV